MTGRAAALPVVQPCTGSPRVGVHQGTQAELPGAGRVLFQGRKCCQSRLCEMARKSFSKLILILGLNMFICFHVAVEEHASQGSVVHRLPLQVQL